jgi:hypothetical protein
VHPTPAAGEEGGLRTCEEDAGRTLGDCVGVRRAPRQWQLHKFISSQVHKSVGASRPQLEPHVHHYSILRVMEGARAHCRRLLMLTNFLRHAGVDASFPIYFVTTS